MLIDSQGIRSVHETIRPYVRRTPVLEVSGADFGIGDCTLVFKLEQLQYSGSFKARGAFANLLTRTVPEVGVVAASGGNHGAAVAYAAKRLGKPATIFVPASAPDAKKQRIEGYGAKLVPGGGSYNEALDASREWAEQSDAMQIHAYNQQETLLGQGTVALELEEQAAPLDALLVAVGGGGLVGGIAAWYAGAIDVVPVESEGCPTLAEAQKAGHPVDVPVGGIAKDSLGAQKIGALMFPIAQQFLQPVTLVDDDSIRRAQDVLWNELRILAEPGGATAFAALLSGRYQPRPGARVGVVICGANAEVNLVRS